MSTVLADSFIRESRYRKTRLFLIILLELIFLWIIFAFANDRAILLFRTTYFDPFFPALYQDDPSLFRTSYSGYSFLFPSPDDFSSVSDKRKAWHPFYLVIKQAVKGTISLGLGTTDFVHGTYGQNIATSHLMATAATVYRVPT